MTRRPARFTQAEAARLMRIAKGYGQTVKALPDGSLIIVPVPESVEKPPVKPERREPIVL